MRSTVQCRVLAVSHLLLFIHFRFNAYRFFVQNVIRVDAEDKISLKFDDEMKDLKNLDVSTWNVMDRWILSTVQSLVSWFHQEMDAYRLYTVVPRLVKFVDQLTNWYVRLNRRRIKVSKINATFTIHT
jgi:isoleucyl-tRNA synthetase